MTANTDDRIGAILSARAQTHGDFREVAAIYTLISDALRNSRYTTNVANDVPELGAALDMLAMKLARLVCGQYWHDDHFDDAIGYLKLAQKAAQRFRP